MPADLLTRKQTHFVLWRPGSVDAPTLFIGPQPQPTPEAPNSFSFEPFREIPLRPSPEFPDLWDAAAINCGLTDGTVYFYWFNIRDTDPYTQTGQRLYITDPIAWTVDRRFLAPTPKDANAAASGDPASVVLYQNGQLVPCDSTGQRVDWRGDASPATFASNNRLVIYELPPRWTRIRSTGAIESGIGTFQDVQALVVPGKASPNFSTVAALNDRAHLLELGVNALELLPVSDSDDILNWGYGTANYFAADFDLGFPDNQAAPTASTDLATLIKLCHQQGLRFFYDAVMAFSRNNPYRNLNFLDFYVQATSGDPEQIAREGFGGDLFKYNYRVEGYHPITGKLASLVPAREYMQLMLTHWMEFYRLDGIRLDSVNNIGSYDFVQEFKDRARSLWQERAGGLGDRFLVVGEDLSVPLALVRQNRVDGLWNETFKQLVRQVILGRGGDSFEQTVRRLIDCRLLGFSDGTQAVNYLTSHDVGGFGNERLYNWLANNGVTNLETRIKLAFVCLLTAVGIPMILAGDEFADQQDLDIAQLPQGDTNKQIDPVNYSRLSDDWRRRVFDYVARLVRFRIASPALAVNDTQFLHSDFSNGRRILVWQRGTGSDIAIIVANFSDIGVAEYSVPNWAPTPAGKRWREVTQDREVADGFVNREAIVPWEAKVYTLV
ncbi:alpha amylase [Leptolyngbya sp. FACHB-36]|uniref:alpha-amylase family glycosyl hydrolase n=1 Tax=Leptolyngbya sp. FACHB-36 TaxID=2692808 RepID=UPI001681B8F5|nr:alpha-amylase family glycosyl hydrolase [Leptolyngbya sp. FACHB-36]MBD2021962.1 alpha amylase [Leptolyngbya sp. FACHB-36]